MIDDIHSKQRQFATQLVRTVLKQNPHLLTVSHFLSRSGNAEMNLPTIRLVYGVVDRECFVGTRKSDKAKSRRNSQSKPTVV